MLVCLPAGAMLSPAAVVRTPSLLFPASMPARHSDIACKADADERERLLASLNAGMNSWSNFDDQSSGAAKKPVTKNAGKQKTKRKGKDGKIYLRDGPKRPSQLTKLDKRRKGTIDASVAAATAAAESSCCVRIEESKAGGKKLTTIRGLEALPSERSKGLLKALKTALAVGGRINGQAQLEIQGEHAEACLLRLKREGFVDVRLAGGAGSKKPGKVAWNAPKEVKEMAEKAAYDAKRTQERKRKVERAAAVATKLSSQLRASEQQELAKLRRSDVPKAEKAAAKKKLERIQQRIADQGA